jgi:tRNA (adenine57-N1/adenine58-N1)-methyltransferase
VEVDRAVLDLTEPWRALPTLEKVLRPGGLVVAYMPTVPQVMNLVAALGKGWAMVRTFETLQRGWNVDGLSVRPDHRMVAHTAFLVVARRVVDDD